MTHPVNAYATFIRINSQLLGAGHAMRATVPPTPEAPLPLPLLTLNASRQATLILQAAADYGAAVTVYAVKPLLAGTHSYGKAAFKRLDSLCALAAGSNTLSALYLARYRVPSPGCEIAFKLVDVTDSGFPASGVLVTGIVTG